MGRSLRRTASRQPIDSLSKAAGTRCLPAPKLAARECRRWCRARWPRCGNPQIWPSRFCQMLTMGAVEALAHHASATLKQRFLPKMVAGEWTGTMNLTEPQAGSDLSAVRTRAEPDGDHYRLFGSKIFITWGEHDVAENVIHLVLARLPDAPQGTRGISLFIGAEIPGEPRWQPRRAQRPCLLLHRTQARHPWLADGRHVIRRQGRRDCLPGR